MNKPDDQPDGPAVHPLTEVSALLPFAQTLGVVIESADASAVTGILEWAPDLCTTGGTFHGGALMGLADNLGGVCAYLNLPEGAATATIESKTNFFRGVRSGRVRGTARPLHIGRSTIVVETDLRDDADRRVALTIQTQAILRPQP
ncbi:MAG: PaaI family thioesterase [Micromonosporaceae bacterium]